MFAVPSQLLFVYILLVARLGPAFAAPAPSSPSITISSAYEVYPSAIPTSHELIIPSPAKGVSIERRSISQTDHSERTAAPRDELGKRGSLDTVNHPVVTDESDTIAIEQAERRRIWDQVGAMEGGADRLEDEFSEAPRDNNISVLPLRRDDLGPDRYIPSSGGGISIEGALQPDQRRELPEGKREKIGEGRGLAEPY